MSHQLNYRRPEKQPEEGFYWRDVIPSVWQQGIGLILCGLTFSPGMLGTWVLAVIGYWVGTAIIAGRGIRPTMMGLDQVFVKWGFPIVFLTILIVLAGLAVLLRW
jgi:hypothetical protein